MKISLRKKWLAATHDTTCDRRTRETTCNPASGILLRIGLIILIFSGSTAIQSEALGQEKPHLLKPNLQRDAPIPLYKSLGEVLEEYWRVFTIVGGTALLFAFGWWLHRRLRKDESNEDIPFSRDPYEEAIEALEALSAESNRMEAKPFVFRLSEVLRAYVQGRFELPALELTGEEFLRETVEHKFFRNHYEDLLREFISRSEIVKYSRESIDGEGLNLLLNSAIHFVKDTHRRLEEERALAGTESEANAA